MERIGSGPRDDVDDAVARAADLGGESSGRNLKLLNRVLGQIRERSANHLVVIVSAIDGDIAAASKAAGRADFKRVGLGGVERRRRAITRQQIGELKKIAAIQRNVFNGVGVI